jgi:hypothetical protein
MRFWPGVRKNNFSHVHRLPELDGHGRRIATLRIGKASKRKIGWNALFSF